jgi:hypothetical protein
LNFGDMIGGRGSEEAIFWTASFALSSLDGEGAAPKRRAVASLSRNGVLWNAAAGAFMLGRTTMSITRRLVAAGLPGLLLAIPSLAHARPAPAFTAVDIDGKTRSLAEFRGKAVVLEWVNEGCPYVRKHYSGNMQGLQQAARADGVVWLTVASSAPGKQGYFADGEAARTWMDAKGAKPTTLLLDSQGWWPRPTRPRPRRTCSSSIRAARSSTRGHRRHAQRQGRGPENGQELCRRRPQRREGGPQGGGGVQPAVRVLGEVQGRVNRRARSSSDLFRGTATVPVIRPPAAAAR